MHRPMYNVYENVVECIKEQFINYSDFVFKMAADSVNKKVEFQVIDETEIEKPSKNPNMNRFVKMKIDLKIDGIKNIVLNTDSLEQKIEASNLLSAMAEYMGPGFLKYAEQMIPIANELVSFKNSKEIRNNMVEVIKHMVINAQTVEQKTALLAHMFPSLSN